MLQSIAKGAAARKTEARAATQAFITESPKPQTIAAGDKNSRRAHDATLVGLAPPPPHHVSSLNTQPLALQPAQTIVSSRDERKLAAILVAGTLIAMFAIAISALPEREPAAPASAHAAQVAPAPAQPVPVQIPAPLAGEPAKNDSAGAAAKVEHEAPPVRAKRPSKSLLPRAPLAPRIKGNATTELRAPARRRVKTTAN